MTETAEPSKEGDLPEAQPLLPIFDGHNDVLLRIWDQQLAPEGFLQGFEGVVETTADDPGVARAGGAGHLDLPRARLGGFCGGFFAMFVPSQRRRRAEKSPSRSAEAQRTSSKRSQDGAPAPPASYRFPYPKTISHEAAASATQEMLALARHLESASEGGFRIVETIEQFDQQITPWRRQEPPDRAAVAAVLHLEGAEAVRSDLENLEALYQQGIRSIGPVWSRANDFAHGVPFAFPCSPDQGPGLSDAGRSLVRACQELGILIDLAHLNEQGFWDVAQISQRPLVATHTAVHSLTPTARNLTDDQIDAIGQSGGVIGVNLHVADLREDGRWNSDTPLERWASHVAYIAERIGTRCVAVGSDFDGALMPRSLADVGGLQRLVAPLRQKGFSTLDLERLALRNWRRVLAKAWSR